MTNNNDDPASDVEPSSTEVGLTVGDNSNGEGVAAADIDAAPPKEDSNAKSQEGTKTNDCDSASGMEPSSTRVGLIVEGKRQEAVTVDAAPSHEASVAKSPKESSSATNSKTDSDMELSSTGAGAAEPGNNEEISAVAARPQKDSNTDSQECNEINSSNGNEEWTLDEQAVLVKHMQKIFEPNFDALDIRSLLPERSEEEIKNKWEFISSMLLSDLSTGKDNDVEGIFSRRKKKQKRDHGIGQWTEADLERLMEIMEDYSYTTPKWDDIARKFPGKTPVDCLTQWQGMSIPHQVKGKGSWTPAEDAILRSKFRHYGNKWSKIAEYLPGRSGKQCRERFVNHLDPNLKKCEWSDDEEAILIGMHKHHGNKWTLIAKNLPGRSDNDVKNHWYSTITRKFQIHGKDKLTVAAIQQVFMLVTAGIISRDLIREWPGAPAAQTPQPPQPPVYQYWYGHGIPPPGFHQHHPLPPAIPPFRRPLSGGKAVEDAQQDTI